MPMPRFGRNRKYVTCFYNRHTVLIAVRTFPHCYEQHLVNIVNMRLGSCARAKPDGKQFYFLAVFSPNKSQQRYIAVKLFGVSFVGRTC